jgi:hypothetical protein
MTKGFHSKEQREKKNNTEDDLDFFFINFDFFPQGGFGNLLGRMLQYLKK